MLVFFSPFLFLFTKVCIFMVYKDTYTRIMESIPYPTNTIRLRT